ncbi:MAG: hypothetical protein AAGJ31_08165, partial [Verrucomicrobiota bacterium]
LRLRVPRSGKRSISPERELDLGLKPFRPREARHQKDAEYARGLSQVVRRYLDRMLGTNLMHQSTDETRVILASGGGGNEPDFQGKLLGFLKGCDQLAFAPPMQSGSQKDQLWAQAQELLRSPLPQSQEEGGRDES